MLLIDINGSFGVFNIIIIPLTSAIRTVVFGICSC